MITSSFFAGRTSSRSFFGRSVAASLLFIVLLYAVCDQYPHLHTEEKTPKHLTPTGSLCFGLIDDIFGDLLFSVGDSVPQSSRKGRFYNISTRTVTSWTLGFPVPTSHNFLGQIGKKSFLGYDWGGWDEERGIYLYLHSMQYRRNEKLEVKFKDFIQYVDTNDAEIRMIKGGDKRILFVRSGEEVHLYDIQVSELRLANHRIIEGATGTRVYFDNKESLSHAVLNGERVDVRFGQKETSADLSVVLGKFYDENAQYSLVNAVEDRGLVSFVFAQGNRTKPEQFFSAGFDTESGEFVGCVRIDSSELLYSLIDGVRLGNGKLMGSFAGCSHLFDYSSGEVVSSYTGIEEVHEYRDGAVARTSWGHLVSLDSAGNVKNTLQRHLFIPEQRLTCTTPDFTLLPSGPASFGCYVYAGYQRFGDKLKMSRFCDLVLPEQYGSSVAVTVSEDNSYVAIVTSSGSVIKAVLKDASFALTEIGSLGREVSSPCYVLASAGQVVVGLGYEHCTETSSGEVSVFSITDHERRSYKCQAVRQLCSVIQCYKDGKLLGFGSNEDPVECKDTTIAVHKGATLSLGFLENKAEDGWRLIVEKKSDEALTKSQFSFVKGMVMGRLYARTFRIVKRLYSVSSSLPEMQNGDHKEEDGRTVFFLACDTTTLPGPYIRGSGYGFGIGYAFNAINSEFGRLRFWQDFNTLKTIIVPRESHYATIHYFVAVNLDTNEIRVAEAKSKKSVSLAIHYSCEMEQGVLRLNTGLYSINVRRRKHHDRVALEVNPQFRHIQSCQMS
ncbi:MAG: hypothetical protein U5N86_05095 [Planctomycetota bacterium]|nr:hypothetical protein [Planctomycetota bacterium]